MSEATMTIDPVLDVIRPAGMFQIDPATVPTYMAHESLREDYVYVGELVWAPRWHNGEVIGWCPARVSRISVTTRDGVAFPSYRVMYSDGREMSQEPYSLARFAAVSAVGARPMITLT